jgi:hypothetical protein
MRKILKPLFICLIIISSCKLQTDKSSINLVGTWQLIQGITVTKGDSAFTDYTSHQRMIKIINGTHFAFLKHDVNTAKDSSLHFDAGGGTYELSGNNYTEHLDFYNDRNWEGKSFSFTISVSGDTLVQKGMEKVEGEGIDREIIEKYARVKP